MTLHLTIPLFHRSEFPVIAILLVVLALWTIGCLTSNDDPYGPVMQLTLGDSDDEDGAFALADD